MSKEVTQAQSYAAAEPFSSRNALNESLEKHVRESEKELIQILDSSNLSLDNRIALPSIQQVCMAVPNLTPLLTGDRRAKLYIRLLLDDKSELETVPDSLASFSNDANKDFHTVATNLMVLLEPIPLEEAQVVGFLSYLSAKTAFVPDEANISLLNFVAVVLSNAEISCAHTALQLLFSMLEPLLKDFAIPLSAKIYDKTISLLMRLILQYHDPALSVHLEQYHMSIGELLLLWIKQLFILRLEYHAAFGILDYILVLGDPVLIPYVALAYIMAHRQRLLRITSSDILKNTLHEFRMELPIDKKNALDPQLVDGRSVAPMPVWSGKILLQNADLLRRNTPQSVRRVLESCLYPDTSSIQNTPVMLENYYAAMPCLPLERSDIALSFPKSEALASGTLIPYIIVDCRSQASFDYARLPTALFVGDAVSFESDHLEELVSRLTPMKGAHYSIFGTGRGIAEESNLLTVVALQLIQRHFPFVSITSGGFKGIIPLVRSNLITLISSNSDISGYDAQNGKPIPTAMLTFFSDAMNSAPVKSMLSGLNQMKESLLPRAVAEVDDVKEKAKQGFSWASVWGAGVMHKMQEKLAFSAYRTSSEEQNSGITYAPDAVDTYPSLQGTTVRTSQSSGPLRGRVLSRPPAQHIFTLGVEEGDSDDLDLITTIPTSLPKGKVIASQNPNDRLSAVKSTCPDKKSDQITSVGPPDKPSEPSEGVSNIDDGNTTRLDKKGTHIDLTLAPVVANIDEEFEQLFGEITTPVRDEPVPSGVNADKKESTQSEQYL